LWIPGGGDWLLQLGIELGHDAPNIQQDVLDIMLEASMDARLQAGV
jgi:hypothetical protein